MIKGTNKWLIGKAKNYKGDFLHSGTVNKHGYIDLDPHIGVIYGDSITIDRCRTICSRLAAQGYSTNNLVLGIGSYTYQYNTRDTFGFALKATHVIIDDEDKEIYKDPKTKGNMHKKSARGLLHVQQNEINGEYELIDQVSWREEREGCLEFVVKEGEVVRETTLDTIRERINDAL